MIPPPVGPGAGAGPGRSAPAPGEFDLSDAQLEAIVARRGRLERIGKELLQIPSLLAGLAILLGLAAIGGYELAAGQITEQLPSRLDWANAVPPLGPSWAHPFGVIGTLGVDVYAAVFAAVPWDLALLAAILGPAVIAGALLGAYAGHAGGWVDALVGMASDVLLSIPPFIFVVVLWLGIGAVLPAASAVRLPAFVLLFVVVIWPYYARPVRARAERVSREPYVEAARAAGAGRPRLILRHVFPNSLFPVFAQIPVDVYNIYFVLTVFPYVGCRGGSGATAFVFISPFPNIYFPEWGTLLGLGACYGLSAVASANFWWMYTFPLAMILLVGLAIMLVCDGLERLLHGRTYGA
jgi:peptide/nickel transport system permease protein